MATEMFSRRQVLNQLVESDGVSLLDALAAVEKVIQLGTYKISRTFITLTFARDTDGQPPDNGVFTYENRLRGR